jgi:hypothetical protein
VVSEAAIGRRHDLGDDPHPEEYEDHGSEELGNELPYV